MACPAVTTGNQFLVQTLAHLDCQVQSIGSFGFQSLAQTGSPAFAVVTGLLTLFIAILGFRLLFGANDGPRDYVGAALKVGIVLTLAASWPAFRTLAFDTVLFGPAEIASSIMPSTLPDPNATLVDRLQNIDNGIAQLTFAGMGRQTGALADVAPGAGFRSIALEDEFGLGLARPIYLGSVIGSLAIYRIAAGLLLALAPLFAGLLLFDFGRGLFSGWVRGLVLTALGSLGLTVLFSVQIAVMEPWIADLLNRRGLGYATPTAPTELLALTGGFALAVIGLQLLLAKVAFQNVWGGAINFKMPAFPQMQRSSSPTSNMPERAQPLSPAQQVSQAVASQVLREERSSHMRLTHTSLTESRENNGPQSTGTASRANTQITPIGSAYRRNSRSSMGSHRQRDSLT